MNIYVASSWRNEQQQEVVKYLRSLGHKVYDFKNPPNGKGGFSWSAVAEDITPGKDWKDWTYEEYQAALNHPLAKEGFQSDFNALIACDCCVLVLPAGVSAALEFGFCAPRVGTIIIGQPREPDLMLKMGDYYVKDFEELAEALKEIEAGMEELTLGKIQKFGTVV